MVDINGGKTAFYRRKLVSTAVVRLPSDTPIIAEVGAHNQTNCQSHVRPIR